MTMKAVQSVSTSGFPFKTLDPFLFAVHHKDAYPAAKGSYAVPGVTGNGADFDWYKPFRMYHGRKVPGFPRHPHRGFETVTATLQGEKGLVAHSDSFGNAALFGQGDLQWMTAGRGIQHSEMFPLFSSVEGENTIDFFQIWLNLPKKHKLVEPAFLMHWANDIPVVKGDGHEVVVFAGEFQGHRGVAPPPHSWAVDPANDVNIWFIALDAGASITIPPAASGEEANRMLYNVVGPSITINTVEVPVKSCAQLDGSAQVMVTNEGSDKSQLLLLSGRPIGEPVAQHGPFVMNTQQEIRQAFSDYQATSFGPGGDKPSWPFSSDDPVTLPSDGKPRRFARQDGVETFPNE